MTTRPAAPAPAPRDPVIAVDLLRLGCALLVLVYHYCWAFAAIPSARIDALLPDAPEPIAWMPAQAGCVGVELFFVISGLVIARSATNTRWTRFLRHRALRLAPAAWLCATLTLTALLLAGMGASDGGAAVIADWWRSVRFWPTGEQIDGSYWTLGVECAFYLMIALAAGEDGKARRIARAGWIIGGASTLFWLYCLLGGTRRMLMLDQTVVLLLLPHGCLFALGMMIGMRPAGGFNRARRIALTALVATAAIEVSAHVGGWRWSGPMLLAEALVGGGIALLLCADRIQSRLARHIAPGTARALGLMTYPLYLLHQEAGAALMGALSGRGCPVWAATALTAAAALAAAWMIARHAEPALRRGLTHLLDHAATATTTTPTPALPFRRLFR